MSLNENNVKNKGPRSCLPALWYLKELDMLFAISYDDSEVINNVSRQQPFQFIKQTVVIKYNIPSALVESQESLSLTCDLKYFHEVQFSMG